MTSQRGAGLWAEILAQARIFILSANHVLAVFKYETEPIRILRPAPKGDLIFFQVVVSPNTRQSLDNVHRPRGPRTR